MEPIHQWGRHVHGELHSADASAGAEIPLYDVSDADGSGQPEAYTLGSDEYLVIESIDLVTDPGGDCHVFFDNDDDNALDAGETIVRGTYAANGGIVRNYAMPFGKRGQAGGKPHVIAPAGVVDVQINGFVRQRLTKSGPV